MRRLAPALLVLAACGGTAPPDTTPSKYIDGYNPPDVKEGFTRYITPIVEAVPPGKDETYCQWLTGISDADVDVVATEGSQSKGGHHVILYATTLQSAPGTTRPCTNANQVSLRFLGGIGGEGVTSAKSQLPPGVVYRLPKGWALMANVHYINTTNKPLNGQAVIDIKTRPADPTAQVASLFASTVVDTLEIPPGEHTIQVTCPIMEELPLVLAGNHMHERGTKVRSQVRKMDGTTELVRDDPIWAPENVFAPELITFPGDAPRILHVGDTLETSCTWMNETSETLYFPSEMCVTFGFYLGSGVQIDCVGGEWSK